MKGINGKSMMQWPKVKFEELYSEPSRNGIYKQKQFHGSGIKIVNMGELFAFDVIGDQDMKRLRLTDSEMQRNLLDNGDLLFGRRSLVESGAGKCSVVEDLSEPTTFESSVIRVRVKKDEIRPRFLFYWFKSRQGSGSVKAIVTGTNVKGIRASVLKDIMVACPKIQIQDKIVERLRAYDDLIENNRRRIQLLEQSARLLYKEWFVHFRFPGHEHVKIKDGVPEGWEKTLLDDICKLRAGDSFKPKYQGQREGEIPFIKVRDLNREGNAIAINGADNWVKSEECTVFKGKPFPEGTIVFAKIGEGLRQNRVRFIVRETLIDNNMMGAIPNQSIKYYSEYLFFVFQELDLASYANGAAIPFISSKILESVKVLIPEMKILILYQEAVAQVFQQIINLELQKSKAVQARDLLLPKLMNGELAV